MLFTVLFLFYLISKFSYKNIFINLYLFYYTFFLELVRRQEELRQIEEEMQNKRHMAQMGRHGGGGGSGMMQNRNAPFENRGPPPQRGQRFLF